MKRKESSQTHVEFAREKANDFERWLKSKEADKDFDKLRELMLMEEFKSCLPSDIRKHLADRGVDKLEKAAVMADDFELVHKHSFGSNTKSDPNRNKSTKPWLKKGEKTANAKQVQPNGSNTESSTATKGKENPAGSSEQPNWRRNRPVCSFCGKIGHKFENCFKRRCLIHQHTRM